jgi:hypothetical protein
VHQQRAVFQSPELIALLTCHGSGSALGRFALAVVAVHPVFSHVVELMQGDKEEQAFPENV